MNPITTKPTRPLARGSLRVQSDGRLVKLFLRGIEPAFDELVRRYRDALVNYAGAIAGRDRADDVVQDSLVKAHRSLVDVQPMEPRPWLYRIVRNTALNDIRDNSKHSHEGIRESAGQALTTHEVVEQRERLAAVVAAVADLPVSQRRALIRLELEGLSHEEIAAELNLSTGATKQLIYRARLTLRNATGAFIPLPLIARLASDTAGVVATGAASGAAGGGGILAGLSGAGAAKLAVVAVVAGSSLTAGVVALTAGVVAEKHHRVASAAGASSGSPGTGESWSTASSGTEPVKAGNGQNPGLSGREGQDIAGKGKSTSKGGKGSGSDDSGSGTEGSDRPGTDVGDDSHDTGHSGSGEDSPGRPPRHDSEDSDESGSSGSGSPGTGGKGSDDDDSEDSDESGSSGSGSPGTGGKGSDDDDSEDSHGGGSSGDRPVVKPTSPPAYKPPVAPAPPPEPKDSGSGSGEGNSPDKD